MLNHASWRLFRAKLKLRFLSRRTQLNRTELGSPPPWAPLRHCHCHSAQLSSNEMKWMATNSARKWHAFISGHETRPSPIRFAQESLVSGEISLPNVWGPGTFMFYFIVLMRIFARDQRKYLLSTILKYERFLAEALASPQVRLRKQLEGIVLSARGCHSWKWKRKKANRSSPPSQALCTEEEVSRTTVEGNSNPEPSMLSMQSTEQRTRPLALVGCRSRRGKSLKRG